MSVRSLFLLMMTLSLAACMGMGSRAPAPVVHYGTGSGGGSAGVHNVNSGDTLYSISKRYNLPMRDLAVINRIQPPFRLYEGQRLKLPPPQEYRVRNGDTLYGISRLFGVSSSQVAKLNDIGPPYTVRTGQVLRLPSLAVKQNVVAKSSIGSAESTKVAAVERTVLPPQKSQEAVIKDGVPIPQNKPGRYVKPKEVKVTKVTSRTPKRASSKFLKPVNGKVISNYGAKKSGLHNDGINIAAPRGTPVKVADNGVVVYAGNALKGSGNLVLVRHDQRWMTAYAHLDSISVRKGQTLTRGSVLGKVGSTGSVSTPQLHFETRRGTSAMNPVKYME